MIPIVMSVTIRSRVAPRYRCNGTPACCAARSCTAMSIAALTDGLPRRILSILSATSRGRSNVNPSKRRAMDFIASIADRTVSPVTSVGAPLPLPEKEPECTTTITFWATVDDPFAIMKGSFRRRSIAAYSRKSIRIASDTHAPGYQGAACSASRGRPTPATGVPRPLRPRIETAERSERALRASGTDRSAEVFPESDEQLVDVEPVLLRHRAHQSPLRRLGSLRPHEAEPIADAMDVGVRRDARHAESVDEDAVRRLRADLGKFDQLLVGPGHRAGVAVEEGPAHLHDLDGLLAVEPDRLDEALQVAGVRRGEFRGGVVFREELPRGDFGHLVAGPLGQNCGDQDFERILRFRDDLRQGRLARVQIPRRQVPAGKIAHDERKPVTGGRRDGQGPPPRCRSSP